MSVRKRRRVRPWLLVVAFGLAATACLSDRGVAEAAEKTEMLKYGLVSAYSGPAAAWGPMEETSIAIAIEEINKAGGIRAGDRRYRLELARYDHAYDPVKAVSVVRQAVQQDGVKFLEVLGGGVIPAVQPITEPAGVIVFGFAAGSSWLGTSRPNTFRLFFDSAESLEASLKYAKSKHPDAKRLTLMYPDDDMGHAVAEKAKRYAETYGVTVSTVFVGRNQTDFYPILTKVLQSDPQIIDVGPNPSSVYAQIVRQARQNGYKGVFIFSSSIDLKTVVKTAGVDAVVGSVASPMWQDWKTEKGKHWAKEYMRRYGSMQSGFVIIHDNLWLLKAAIEKAETIDTKAVAKALGEVSVDGAMGTVRYGGAADFGLPRAFVMPIAVATIVKGTDGAAEPQQVYVSEPRGEK